MAKDNIEIKDIDENTKIVKISGEIDINNVDEEIEKVQKLVKKQPKKLNLIFDFKELGYINSNGIGHIINLTEQILDGGGNVAIINVKDNVMDILDTIGITNIVKIYDTEKDALEAIKIKK